MSFEKSNKYRKNRKNKPLALMPMAGFSSRMDQWKLGLRGRVYNQDLPHLWGQELALARYTCEVALLSCEKLIVIGGHRFSELQTILAPLSDRLILLENKDYQRGMLSSLQRAESYIDGPFLVVPGDMPLLSSDLYSSIWNISLDKFKGERITRYAYQGRPGHPIFMPSSWGDRLPFCKGSQIKDNLKDERVEILPYPSDDTCLDLDTVEDLENYKKRKNSPFIFSK